MQISTRPLGLLLTLLALLAPTSALPEGRSEPPRGSGTLDALGPDGSALGPCPLEHTRVSTEISGFVARVTVVQTFRNPHPDPIEAIYTFPLSERGAVDAMKIRTGGREIRGEIKRREEAREIYERARDRGQLAALLDQERPNIFTQSLANLMPGAAVEVEIQYVETLVYEDGSFAWSFPMVVGPRFVPGVPTGHSGTGRLPDTNRVPDASRITPPVAPEGTRAGHDVSLEVTLDAGVAIESLDSRLHEIDVERPSKSRAHVRLRDQKTIPNRDFVLRYAVAGRDVKSGVLTHRADGDGYASFILIPPQRVTAESASPKEMVFVIDRSGSQSGLPLAKAKETMLFTLDHLNPNDTFQIVSFSNQTEKLFAQPQPVTADSVARARSYIQALQANGGTMMAEAVREVCAQPAEGNRLRIVTFMTDGYVGNDFEVINLVKRLRGRSRWFPFGTGNSVNRFLLDQMAWHGGGEVEYVLLNDDGQAVARRFHERIAQPVLTDLQLEFRDLDVYDVMPYQLQDLWAQKPLIIHARYGRAGKGTVVLRGYRQGKPYEQRLDVELPRRHEDHAGIASIWARARVDELMARDLQGVQSGNFPDALREEIVTVAIAHRIMTQFTSFVAVEDRVVNENGRPRTVTVPVELPQGVDRQGALGGGAFSSAEELELRRGHASKRVHAKREIFAAQRLPSTLATNSPGEAGRADRFTSRDEPPALKKELTDKLGPALRALVEGRVPPIPHAYGPDGRLTVKVTLARSTPEVLDALRKAGLRVRLVTGRELVGELLLADLEALLALDAVQTVELR